MSKVRILVVEDENVVALDLQETLRNVGYEVVGIASSASEAVRKASQHQPDLILMDIELRGGSDGVQAAAAIKQTSGAGIIFLTAYADEKTVERAKAVEPLAYLLKPFNDRDLYAAIEVALDAQRRRNLERRESQEALLQSEERFRALVEGVREYALYLLDPEGRLATWNTGAERIYGYSADEIAGTHFSRFFTEDDRRAGTPGQALEYAAAHGRWHNEGRRARKDGSTFWAQVDITALRHENGRLRGFACVAHDITEQKQFEDRRRQLLEQERAARKEAERLNRIKDEFLQILSHELRTPLTPILGWTQQIRSNAFDAATVERAVDIIERNARAQINLIEDLLHMGQIISGKLSLNLEPCLLAGCVEAAIETIHAGAESKGIQIRLVKEPGDSIVVGDPVRLEQIFWNLLAVKFTPEKGRIEVLLSTEGRSAIVQVRDTGEGIAPEFLPHLFERFTQANSSTTRRHGGLGLGLSIVKHLVEGHGGKISAESQGKSRGATFTVELPLAGQTLEEFTPRPIPEAAAEEPGLLAGTRILVVDDNQDALDLLSVVLKRVGAIPVLASSVSEAMAKMETDAPALVIADIGMPGEDGYDLLRKTSERNSGLPVIALTAFAGKDERHRAIEEGFREHIAKPFEPERLISVVRSVLEQSNQD